MSRNMSGLKRPYTRRIPEPTQAAAPMTETETTQTTEAATTEAPSRRVTRESRRAFGSMDQKLAAPKRPGFHRHWFNEIPGRIDAAREAGYEHVQDRHGKNERRVVGKTAAGEPLYGYLMEIPQEWYDDDVEKEQAHVDETDLAIRRGKLNEQQDEKRYVPEHRGIKISSPGRSR